MNVFDLFAKLSLDSSEYDKGLSNAKSAGSALGSGLASAAKIGLSAVTAATGATVAFGAASVKTGMDFDSSMSQVAATMGTTVDQIDNLRNFAQEMGRTTAFSATQAADALNYMALAGYDAETSMEMLPNVLNLAAAGDMDLARASDMVTDSATAMGMTLADGSVDIERVTQMVDEMAKAASTGNTSVEQLGDAFLTVGGLAQELNGGMVTLEDGTTATVDGVQELEIALTAMANAGIKGSEAGTHMRNMLLKLSSPTDAGTQALEAMGVAVFDAEGNMRSLKDIMGDLSGAMDSMTQEEKIQTIADLFNTRDIASAEALLGAVGQDWDEIGASIVNAEGAAQQMADTQLDNLSGDVTLFKSALEGAQIAISDTLSPALREFVQFGTNGLSELTSAFQSGGLDGAMEAFGGILSDGLNMIIEKLPEAVDAGMQLLGALGQGLLDNLPTITATALIIAQQLLSSLIEAAPTLISGGAEMLVQLAMGIAEALPELIPQIIDAVLMIQETLIENADMLIDAAIALIMGLAEGLINAMPILIEKQPEIIMKMVEALIANAPKILEAAAKLIVMLAQGIIQYAPQAVNSMITLLGNVITAITGKFGEFLSHGKELISRMVTGMKNMKAQAVQAIHDMMNNIKAKITQWFEAAKTWGMDLIKNFIAGIKSKIEDLKNTLGQTAETVKKILGFSEPEEGPLSNFHTFAPDMMDLFMQGIKDKTGELRDTISDAFNIQGTIDADMSAAKDVAGARNDEMIISLLQEIRDNGTVIVNLEGDADRLFRVIQSKATSNYRLTGQRDLVTV